MDWFVDTFLCPESQTLPSYDNYCQPCKTVTGYLHTVNLPCHVDNDVHIVYKI